MAAICAICKSQFSKAFQYYGFELDQIISLHNLVGDALIMNKKRALELLFLCYNDRILD